ncbi:MAG: SCO family protein [Anaerolineae bacterium]
MSRKVIYVFTGVLAILLAVAAFLFFNRSASLTGAVIEPPPPAAELNLTDQHGRPFSMSSQRGKVVLLYFGYTNCPDECPLTMAHLKLVHDRLGSRAKDLQVVMITTDPARDTPQALAEFMGKFDPSFLGLTGSTQQLQKAWQDYGVAVEDGGETHSYYVYVIDPEGKFRETFLPDSEPAAITGDIDLLLKSK